MDDPLQTVTFAALISPPFDRATSPVPPAPEGAPPTHRSVPESSEPAPSMVTTPAAPDWAAISIAPLPAGVAATSAPWAIFSVPSPVSAMVSVPP
jgi:hypothetical protein